MMNARARELGANATYKNPHGLDAEGHEASALALALIAREGLQNDWFREIVSTQRMTIPWSTSEYNRLLVNKNKLLSSYEGALGVKTGSRQSRALPGIRRRARWTYAHRRGAQRLHLVRRRAHAARLGL